MLRKWLLKFAPMILYPVCLRWWLIWSKVYRWMFQQDYKDVGTIYMSPSAAQAQMHQLTWTADGFTELWDSCGHPGWVQHCLNQISLGCDQPHGSLDCDDFSVWAANVVYPTHEPRLFSLVWMNEEGKIAGHVVCVCKALNNDNIFHVGNWGRSQAFSDLRALSMDMLDRAGAEIPIGWCVLTRDLKLVKYGIGKPEAGYDGNVR